MTKEELRGRILEIVNRKYKLTDMEIWQESAPAYLPWNRMIEEIKTLDREKKLRLEVVRPGHLIIHSLEAPPETAEKPKAARKPATKHAAAGRKSKRSTKAPK